jgi:hypothetical protein
MSIKNNTQQSPLPPMRAHLVALRREGQIEAWQVRIGSGGPGLSRSFATRKYGGEAQALAEAKRTAQALGLELGHPRGGSPLGRRTRLSPTPAPGIRFEWLHYSQSTVLNVVANWPDPRTGRRCSSRYSVERNGLDGALDRALENRRKAGAPMPDRQHLLDLLTEVYRSGAPAVSKRRQRDVAQGRTVSVPARPRRDA